MSAFDDLADVLTYAAFVALPFLTGAILLWLVRSSMRAASGDKKPSILLANVVVLLFLTSTVLAVSESYYRFFCDATDSYGLTRNTLRWFHRHWKVNHSGYRDDVDEYLPRRTLGKRRISFIGDSFTAGHGIANVDDRFANRIRNASQYEVHVLANTGFDTGDELKVVQGLIAQNYQFDEVVLVYNLNDISDICPEDKALEDGLFNVKSQGFLVKHSFLCNTLYYRLKARFDPYMGNYYQFVRKHYDDSPSDQQPERLKPFPNDSSALPFHVSIWDRQQERLKQFRNLVETHGGHLLVVTFPFLHHLGPGYDYRPVHAKLAKFWQDQAVSHLDLLPLYEAHLDHSLVVNAHDPHPNVFAHALAAEAIKEFLSKNVRTDGHPQP